MLDANDVPAVGVNEWRPGTLRGAPGYFRVGQDAAGRWTLLEPEGRPFYCRAVHGVRAALATAEGELPADSIARLRRWGFNVLGANCDVGGRDDGLPYMGVVDFFGAGATIVAPGGRLPDVFDPHWPQLVEERARAICAPAADERMMLGWITDDRLAWAQPSMAGRPSLLQICLSLEPSFAAYHAAWEFALALHGGRLDALARAWGMALPNKEVVRELTRAEEGIGSRGYLRDEARWAREFARRYFSVTANAIRNADPNHLVLGCRSEALLGPAVMAECSYPAVDVTLCDWRELPRDGSNPAAADVAPAATSRSDRPTGNPVIATNVGWTSPEFLRLPTAARLMRLTSVEWMLRRGRTALERMARHPAVVGYAWGAWQDEPGEQPPFARGLVHGNGVEAREHTELLGQFNHRVEALRAGTTPPTVFPG